MIEEKEKVLENAKIFAKRLYDLGAKKVELLDISKKNEEFLYMILSSSNSSVASHLLADEIKKFAEKKGVKIYKIDGEFKGEWIVFDFGWFVMHILVDSARIKYNLDKFWKAGKNQIKFQPASTSRS
ncbi:MAG: ribosome silencing factor [Clostridia bacterium]|nr:ribosome silencing factor [Clostridia bacterium]